MNSKFILDDLFLTLYKEKKRFHVNYIFRALYTDKRSGNRPPLLIRRND